MASKPWRQVRGPRSRVPYQTKPLSWIAARSFAWQLLGGRGSDARSITTAVLLKLSLTVNVIGIGTSVRQ